MGKLKRIVSNIDNEDLLPGGNEVFVVGYVEHVNGPGAEEVLGFLPTQHELITLVKHWYRCWLRNNFDFFLTSCVGSCDLRESDFASRRINRIQTVVGQETVEEAIAQVEAEFSKEVGAEKWNIFCNGDKAQWAAVQERFHTDMKRFEAEIEEAQEQIKNALGDGTEATKSMIAFMHEYRDGLSPYALGDPILLHRPHASEAEVRRATELLRILEK